MTRKFGWLLLAFPLCFSACGGDGSSGGDDDDAAGDDDDVVGDDDDDDGNGVVLAECNDPFSACGGDPTGVWDVIAVCDPGIDFGELGCPAVTYEITADRSSGTVFMNADNTYDRTYDVDVDYALTVPTSCLLGMSCSDLVAYAADLVDTCVESGDNCDCNGTFQTLDAATGTWIVDGNTIVTDGVDRMDFCVNGNQAETMDEDDTRAIWSK